MTDAWVVNASPLITLAKAGRLALLEALAGELLIPDAVVSELLCGAPDDPARRAVEGGWGTRLTVPVVPPEVIAWSLGAGEGEVIAGALARGEGTAAILDDAQGRACARAVGVPVLGTLGVILRAKQRGDVPSAAQVIRELRAVGLFLNDNLIAAVLHTVSETWVT